MIETVQCIPSSSNVVPLGEFCVTNLPNVETVSFLALEVTHRGSGNPLVNLVVGRTTVPTTAYIARVVEQNTLSNLLVVDVPGSPKMEWFIMNQARHFSKLLSHSNLSMVHHSYLTAMQQLLFNCTQRVTPPGLTKDGRVKFRSCHGLAHMTAHVGAALQVLRMWRYFEGAHAAAWSEMSRAICARGLTTDGATSDMMQHLLVFLLSGVATPAALLTRMLLVAKQRMLAKTGTISRWPLMGMAMLQLFGEHCGRVRVDSSDAELSAMATTIATHFMCKQKQAACRNTFRLLANAEKHAFARHTDEFDGLYGMLVVVGMTVDAIANIEPCECPVCLERLTGSLRRDGTYLPCGHAICRTCASRLQVDDRDRRRCPYCRAQFDSNIVLWRTPITGQFIARTS
jgi:hypothetical protein